MSDFSIQDRVHEFEVCTKSKSRVVLQIDFQSRQIQLLERGKEKKCCGFHECSSAVSTGGLWFEMKLRDRNKQLMAENIQELRVIFNLLHSAIESLQDGISTETYIRHPHQDHHIIKQGFMEKKGNTIWEKWQKRLVCVKPGQFAYYKPHMKNALHIVGISEQTSYVERDGEYGLKIVVKDRNRTYWFRLTGDTNEDNKAQLEINEWIVAFENASRGQRETVYQQDPFYKDSILPVSIGHQRDSEQSGYSFLSDVPESLEQYGSDESDSSVFISRDPYLPISPRTIDAQLFDRNLLPNMSRRPSEKADGFITGRGKPDVNSGPPPLPTRFSFYLPPKNSQRVILDLACTNMRPRIDTGPHDYPAGSSQRLKQEQQGRRPESERHVNNKEHSNSHCERLWHPYVNMRGLNQLNYDTSDLYLNPDFDNTNSRLNCTSMGRYLPSYRSSIPSNMNEQGKTDSVLEDVDRSSFCSIRRPDVQLHIEHAEVPGMKEIETIQPLEGTKHRHMKSHSQKSDYGSWCSFSGSPGVLVEDEIIPIVLEREDEEVEKGESSHSASISAIGPTDVLENKTDERIELSIRKTSRKIRQPLKKVSSNMEDNPTYLQITINHDTAEVDANTSTERIRIDNSEVDSGNESCQSEIGRRSSSMKHIESVCDNQILSGVAKTVVMSNEETNQAGDVQTSYASTIENNDCDTETKPKLSICRSKNSVSGLTVIEYV